MQGCSLRHEVGLVDDLVQMVDVQVRKAFGANQTSQVQHADHMVDAVPVDGQARVAAVANCAEDRCPVVIEIDAVDLVVRDHDVINTHILQLENTLEHAMAFLMVTT